MKNKYSSDADFEQPKRQHKKFKSKEKRYGEGYTFDDYKKDKQKKHDRNLSNAIKSKNVTKLLNYDDDED